MIQVAAGNPAIPEAEHVFEPTSVARMETAIAALKAAKDAWVKVGIPERIRLIDAMVERTLAEAPAWVAGAMKAKDIHPGTPLEAEDYMNGPYCVLRNLRLLKRSLQDVEKFGAPKLPGKPRKVDGGKIAVPVFPTDAYDKILFQGFSAEIWMQPGVSESNLKETQAVAYRNKATGGKVALVLGAGNVSSIGPMDALYKLFVEDQVVLLKMNPVNEYNGPVLERIFEPLAAKDWFRVVYGGAEQGKFLCQHADIDEIHITGSDKTHDAIVFGGGAQGAKNKADRTPVLTKRITSELGNVSPVIIVPGPWSASDLDYHGANLATMLTNNAGFNCVAMRVIVTHKGWDKRDALIAATEETFAKAHPRKPYYPGARQRYDSFVAEHPDAKRFGPDDGDAVPFTLIENLDPEKIGDICYRTEAFCGVAGEVALEASTVAGYIDKAVDFANGRLWGTLSATLLVHPASLKDKAVADAVNRAIANLRYGSVVINHFAGVAYGLVSPTWGAYPGHDLYDIGSGVGVVHNTYMFDKPEKTVVHGPFKMFPKPPWFVTSRYPHELAPKLLDFEAKPSPLKLPGILKLAIKG